MLLSYEGVGNWVVGVRMLTARGKEVKFTFHAQRRLSERHITDEQVVKVLEKPDTESRARSKGCRRAERRLGKKTVGIV